MVNTLKIDGVDYPCRSSLGAMLYFKDETGKEATELNISAPSEVVVFLWACVKADSERLGKEFDMSVQQFANRVSMDELQAWVTHMQAEADNTESSKKKQKTVKH